MQEEISKVTNVSFYGLGDGKFIPEFDVLEIVKKEEPDVIVFWSNQLLFKNGDKTDVLKYCKCGESHESNFERHVKFLNSNKINIGSVVVAENIIDRYRKACPNTYFFWLPTALEHRVYIDKNYEDRPWDCCFVGSTGANYYPLRVKIINKLKNNPKIKFYWKHLETQEVTPEWWNFELTSYVELLNKTKITPFSNGIYNYPVQRWHEAMACGCLIIAEKPLDAEALHFKEYENYVPIDPNNFEEQILYYLRDENERKRIIRNAKETLLKHNTIETRVKELLSQLIKPLDF